MALEELVSGRLEFGAECCGLSVSRLLFFSESSLCFLSGGELGGEVFEFALLGFLDLLDFGSGFFGQSLFFCNALGVLGEEALRLAEGEF